MDSPGEEGTNVSYGGLHDGAHPGTHVPHTPIPVLLVLPRDFRHPPIIDELAGQTREDNGGGIPKGLHESFRPAGMHGTAARAAEPFYQDRRIVPLKIPAHVPMAPHRCTLTPRTPQQTGPGIRFAPYEQILYIDGKLQYHDSAATSGEGNQDWRPNQSNPDCSLPLLFQSAKTVSPYRLS